MGRVNEENYRRTVILAMRRTIYVLVILISVIPMYYILDILNDPKGGHKTSSLFRISVANSLYNAHMNGINLNKSDHICINPVKPRIISKFYGSFIDKKKNTLNGKNIMNWN
jgi:hypothetical protein